MSINPFSGFLSPAPPQDLGLLTVRDLATRVTQRDLEAQRRKEVAADDSRANSYLKIQQDEQGHRFAKEGQKEVEQLLAEYQDAEDQGDPVRLARVTQQLKRFGMDVGQKPDLRSFTGERALPKAPVNLREFTGQDQIANPIDEAIQTELSSRDALRARNAQPETDLPQEDFEAQLISGSQGAPSRYEQDGRTTDEFRKMLPQSPEEETVDLGDVDSPQFQAAAQAEAQDLGDVDSPEFQAAAQAEAKGLPTQGLPRVQSAQGDAPVARRLPTQSLPTVISKGGKQLYESTGPSGRWAPMVSGVFEPFASHENPEIAAAARRAQSVSSKLIEVDGIPPKEAIKIGMDYLQSEATRLTNLERTKIGSKPKYAGTGAGTGILGPKEDRAESIDKYGDNIETAIQHAGIPSSNEKLTAAENAIMSEDPALQKDALKLLLQARSGLTVSEGERRSYTGIDGLLPMVQNQLLGWAGQPMSPTTRKSLLSIIRNMRSVNAKTIQSITAREKRRYLAQNKDKVSKERLEERAAALAGEQDNSDLYE